METKKALYAILLKAWNDVKSLFDTDMQDSDWEELVKKCNAETREISQQYGQLERDLYTKLTNEMMQYAGEKNNKKIK